MSRNTFAVPQRKSMSNPHRQHLMEKSGLASCFVLPTTPAASRDERADCILMSQSGSFVRITPDRRLPELDTSADRIRDINPALFSSSSALPARLVSSRTPSVAFLAHSLRQKALIR